MPSELRVSSRVEGRARLAGVELVVEYSPVVRECENCGVVGAVRSVASRGSGGGGGLRWVCFGRSRGCREAGRRRASRDYYLRLVGGE